MKLENADVKSIICMFSDLCPSNKCAPRIIRRLFSLLSANKRTAQVETTSLLFGDIIYLCVYKFNHGSSSHFFQVVSKRTCLNYILDLNTLMFRHKTQNRENQKSAIKTSSAVAECVPYAVPERQENNHSTKIYKFSADRLPQHLMNTPSVFIVLICLFVLTLGIVGLSCQCFHSPTQGGRCLQGNLWYSPPAIMTSRLASVTFKMASKVFMEATDKNFQFLTEILFRFLGFGGFKVSIVIEN